MCLCIVFLHTGSTSQGHTDGIYPFRLLMNGEITDEDVDWVLCRMKSNVEAFLGIVQRDLSCTFMCWDPDLSSMVASTSIAVMGKGYFATLQKGFWFVKDRLLQSRFDDDMKQLVDELYDGCGAKAQKLLGSQPVVSLASSEIPDRISSTITILESKGREPLPLELHTSLKQSAESDAIVKQVVSGLPGWRTNEINETPEVLQKAAFRLRCVRSCTTFARMQQDALSILPQLVDPNVAINFHETLCRLYTTEDDMKTLLTQVGFDASPLGGTTQSMLVVTGWTPPV